jgi:hypothetical protein
MFFRKKWFDYVEEELYQSAELSITNTKSNDLIKVDVKQMLMITKIYHLELLNIRVFSQSLILLLRLLPDLNSLKIHSLLVKESQMLNEEDRINFDNLKITNKIKKVYIESIEHHEEFLFLIAIFRQMIIFKVDNCPGLVIESIQNTIKKNNDDTNKPPRAINIHYRTSDYGKESLKTFERNY